jgi:predicted TIM-barrel fold metal-dependent hydrolase
MAEDTPAAPLSLPARPLVRAPASLLPPGTCDCHFHVIPPGRPFSPSRGYTPPIQPIAGWRRMADAVGIARGVLVQPSIYGMDNRALLGALAAHPGTLRGVVVIPTDTTPAEIARLHRLGVRGVRINPLHATGLGLAAVPAIARLIRPFGWHLQFQIEPRHIADVAAALAREPMPSVVDHLAFLRPGSATLEADLAALQRLLDAGTYVKLSAVYRLAPAPQYPGIGAIVERLARSHPERLLWGSDWPHTDLYDEMPDDADLVETSLAWLAGTTLRDRVFVANPQAVYWAT